MKRWRLFASFAAALVAASAAIQPATAQPAPPGPASDRVAVHYINVDQGSASLVEFPCGAILIDAGGRNSVSTNALIAYLEAFFARRTDLGRRLDAVFLTHNHDDHDRALLRVARTFQVRGYVHNGQPRTESSGAGKMIAHAEGASPPIPVQAISEADFPAGRTAAVEGSIVDPLACPRVNPRIRVLSGGHGATTGEFRNPNNHSLVIRVDYGDASFLFTGDLETAGIGRLLSRYDGTRALDVGVYLVGHHGAENGTTSDFLEAMTPELAVISMGPPTRIGGKSAWAHGHARRVAVELLEGAISRSRATPITPLVADDQETFAPLGHPLVDAIYGTGWEGNIVVSADADGVFEVETRP